MSDIYKHENKKLEIKYGPAIAQFICDELEKSERMTKEIKERKCVLAENDNNINYKAA